MPRLRSLPTARNWLGSWSAAAIPSASPRQHKIYFAILLAALSSVFFFSHERGLFYRHLTHNDITAQTMAIATNLAAEHRFLLFYSRYKNSDGTVVYEVYHRYPFGTYLAVWLVSLPFDDPTAQLWAARILMLLFFAGAAMYAHLALCRITKRPEIALIATLLTFSSFYFLYYADFVATDLSGIFGLMMIFHALVKFGEGGTLRPLCCKTALAVALDWHVMTLVFMFIAFSVVAALFERRPQSAPRRSIAVALWRNRHLRYGAFAASFCAMVMAFQLANEYAAFDGRIPFMSLPTIESYKQRLLVVDDYALAWKDFLSSQFHRFSALTLPSAVLMELDVVWLRWQRCCHKVWHHRDYGVVFLVLSCLAVFMGMPRGRRLAAAALLASGWCWALVVRGSSAFHDFEILFMVGAPLAFYAALGTMICLWIPRPLYVLFGLALGSAAVFSFSAYKMAKVGHFDIRGVAANGYELHRQTMSDVATIRKLTPEGSSICISNKLVRHIYAHRDSALKFFFARRVVTIAAWCAGRDDGYSIVLGTAQFREELPNATLLTPENQLIFLYRRSSAKPATH